MYSKSFLDLSRSEFYKAFVIEIKKAMAPSYRISQNTKIKTA